MLGTLFSTPRPEPSHLLPAAGSALVIALALPVFLVSGGHSAAFEAICDVLQEHLGADRAVFPGADHSVQRVGAPFNDLLADFVARAEAMS